MPETLNIFHVGAAALIAAGLYCDVIVLQRFGRTRQWRVDAKPWGIPELLMGTVAVLGLLLLANLAYTVAARYLHLEFDELAPVIIPVELTLRVIMLAGFALFFRRQQIALRPAIGLDALPPRRAVGWGLVFGLASLPPVGLIIFVSDAVCRYFGIEPTEQPVTELFTTTDSTLLLAMLSLFALVVAPIFEEFFFRGFAYPALKARLGTVRALVLVSGIFAASHMHAPSFVPLFALAVGLALAYELTGSLLTSITMHALFNGLMLVRILYERTQT